MTAYLLTNHLLNFMAPAAFLALFMVGVTRLTGGYFTRGKPWVTGWKAQFLWVFAVNLLVLVLGLVVFRQDGKMLTYLGLALGSAVCQGVLLRSWKA